MKFRAVVLMVLFVLLLGMIPAALAQDAGACLNLSAEDCNILTTATANTTAATSYRQDFTFSLSATGLAAFDPSAGDINVTASGGGPFVLTGTGEYPFALQMSVDGSAASGADQQAGTTEIVIVDNVAYFKTSEESGWMGISLNDALSQASTLGGIPVDPSSVLGGGDGAAPAIDPNMLAGLDALTQIPGFIDFSRLADEVLMEQNSYPFQLTISLTSLFQSADFQTMVNGLVQGASQDPNMAFVAALIPALLPNIDSTITITEWVGADDMFIHKLALNIDFNLDMAAVMGVENTPPIAVDMLLEVTLSEFNSTFDIVAPEGATMIQPNQQ